MSQVLDSIEIQLRVVCDTLKVLSGNNTATEKAYVLDTATNGWDTWVCAIICLSACIVIGIVSYYVHNLTEERLKNNKEERKEKAEMDSIRKRIECLNQIEQVQEKIIALRGLYKDKDGKLSTDIKPLINDIQECLNLIKNELYPTRVKEPNSHSQFFG